MRVVRGWDASGARSWTGSTARSLGVLDLLAERWSIIILRNILIGCRTFNEIADGAPGLSRGLLSKRLRDLERAGVVEILPKPDGPGSFYEPTQAGLELSNVMSALHEWGSKWGGTDARTGSPRRGAVGLGRPSTYAATASLGAGCWSASSTRRCRDRAAAAGC